MIKNWKKGKSNSDNFMMKEHPQELKRKSLSNCNKILKKKSKTLRNLKWKTTNMY